MVLTEDGQSAVFATHLREELFSLFDEAFALLAFETSFMEDAVVCLERETVLHHSITGGTDKSLHSLVTLITVRLSVVAVEAAVADRTRAARALKVVQVILLSKSGGVVTVDILVTLGTDPVVLAAFHLFAGSTVGVCAVGSAKHVGHCLENSFQHGSHRVQ